ncbi:HDOD domain-containing protein [Pseudoalteromonas sp. SSM20]|uniref:HDOD domain-containing protein n=1 Tax=Pseudoalteromonas sp. SSM20 TaxID=3139394 RepID=UPI003BAB0E9B
MFKKLIAKVFPSLKQEIEADHFYFENTKQGIKNEGEINFKMQQIESPIDFKKPAAQAFIDSFYELLFNSLLNNTTHDPLSDLIENKLLQLLRQPNEILSSLPVVPSSLTEVMNTLNSVDFNVDKLISLISEDPVIAAKVLELANSSFYNRSNKPISDLKNAFMLLGQKGLTEGVINGFVTQMVPRAQIYFKNYGKNLWLHSQITGRISKQFVAKQNQNAEEAYLVGLLINLGCMVIFQLMIDAFASVCPDSQPNAHNLKRLITAYGQRLTLDIAKLWHFPRNILESLAVQTKITDKQALINYSKSYPIAAAVFEANQLAMLTILVMHTKLSLDELDIDKALIVTSDKDTVIELIHSLIAVD